MHGHTDSDARSHRQWCTVTQIVMHDHTDIKFTPLVDRDAAVSLRVAPTALSLCKQGKFQLAYAN